MLYIKKEENAPNYWFCDDRYRLWKHTPCVQTNLLVLDTSFEFQTLLSACQSSTLPFLVRNTWLDRAIGLSVSASDCTT